MKQVTVELVSVLGLEVDEYVVSEVSLDIKEEVPGEVSVAADQVPSFVMEVKSPAAKLQTC